MHGMNMDGMGWMMAGMGLIALLVVVFLVTGIASFVRGGCDRPGAGEDRQGP